MVLKMFFGIVGNGSPKNAFSKISPGRLGDSDSENYFSKFFWENFQKTKRTRLTLNLTRTL